MLAKGGGIPYRKAPFPEWPIYDEREEAQIKEVLQSHNWWRVSGCKVNEFEAKFAAFQGCNYCLGVTNGTSAIELALTALQIGAGDEVIVPAMTFISTGLAVINCNATPVLVDIDPYTLCMMPDQFEMAISERTKAVIPVHMAGNACFIEKICDIARKHNLYVIEDAAHAHGGEYRGKRLGSFGDAAIFSFQNGKLMTCGEGGALLTNNKEVYDRAYLIQDVGRPRGDKLYKHLVRGDNFRMNEFQAAILLAQLERVDEYNQLRHKNASLLDRLLVEDVKGIIPQCYTKGTNIVSHYMYMFYYDKTYFGEISRDHFVELLNGEGIPSNVCFPVMSEVDFCSDNDFGGRIVDKVVKQAWPNAERAAHECVWLHHRVLEGGEQDICDIVGAIKKIQNSLI